MNRFEKEIPMYIHTLDKYMNIYIHIYAQTNISHPMISLFRQVLPCPADFQPQLSNIARAPPEVSWREVMEPLLKVGTFPAGLHRGRLERSPVMTWEM